MKNIVKVNNVSKNIGTKKILCNVSFEIEENTIVGIVGPNGAGKSTLLKIMTGLYKADSGTIEYDGISLNDNFEKAINMVGCLIEGADMYSHLSGKTNLEIFKSMFKGVDVRTVENIVRIVDIEKSLGKKFKSYSMGTKERFGIASALINNPKILILDEPTNGLDPYGIRELRNLLLNLKNTTIIISSHLLSEIEAICDVVLFMNNGKIINKQIINKVSNKKYVDFEVDNYSRAKVILNNYCVNEGLRVYETDCIISDINKELIMNDIKVYRISESNCNIEEKFFDMIEDKNDKTNKK